MSQNSCLLGEEDTTVPGWEESAPQVDNWLRSVFKIQCFIIIIRDKRDPQFLGNFALILIQVALFALLQLSEHYETFCDGKLIKGTFLILLAVGTVLLTVTINESFGSVVIIVMGFLILAAFLNHAVPEPGQEGVVWIVIVTVFQAFSLGMAYRASTKLKSTRKTA